MKYWKCPGCKRERSYNILITLKICYFCQEEMKLIEYQEKKKNKFQVHVHKEAKKWRDKKREEFLKGNPTKENILQMFKREEMFPNDHRK